MESSPGPWISALRNSHDRLRAAVEPLSPDQLEEPSYDSEWSIAQVLSHLGSQAEIFGLLLDAGLTGSDAPSQDAFPPIWEAWNARSPEEQAADSVAANEEHVSRLEAVDPDRRDAFRLAAFGMDLDFTTFLRLRLAEHAVHCWDITVALDDSAAVLP